ncbi:MAG: hypothetical protein C0626_01490 [Arcobacter sp.]|uniref:hypothetical protein n=1 Tax=uncultured Arcobacter sp. TaxID=165434 RepID=UPI000CCA0408|nr:hypothetical protein [uncultured Arcobacter sp.]PLY11270.1 MAG: hypothetical protein C0626_01490 [Arcobacter sp.]
MQVEASNNVNSTNKTQTSNSNVENSSESLFSSLLAKDVSPKDISYDEYKNLTAEDINRLYPKEDMPNENAKALSLFTKANTSEDEILNQVLFDFELKHNDEQIDYNSKSIDEKAEWHVSSFFDFTVKSWDNIKDIRLVDPETGELLGESEPKPWAYEKKITAEYLFSTYNTGREYFNDKREYFEESLDKERFLVMEKRFVIQDSIQREYEKRVSERDGILNSYTSNNKANPLNNIKSDENTDYKSKSVDEKVEKTEYKSKTVDEKVERDVSVSNDSASKIRDLLREYYGNKLDKETFFISEQKYNIQDIIQREYEKSSRKE